MVFTDLWAWSMSRFRQCFSAYCSSVETLELVPYSLRRGGATYFYTKTDSLHAVMVRGRWRDQATARIYLDDARASLILFWLSPTIVKPWWTYFDGPLSERFIAAQVDKSMSEWDDAVSFFPRSMFLICWLGCVVPVLVFVVFHAVASYSPPAGVPGGAVGFWLVSHHILTPFGCAAKKWCSTALRVQCHECSVFSARVFEPGSVTSRLELSLFPHPIRLGMCGACVGVCVFQAVASYSPPTGVTGGAVGF